MAVFAFAILLFLSGQGLAEAGHDLRLDRQLLGRTLESGLGEMARDAVELEQDPARLDAGDPELGAPLPEPMRTSAGFERNRNVRENADPETAGYA